MKAGSVNEKNIFKALQEDLNAAKPLRQEWDAKIEEWKKWYNGEPYGNEKKGKSAVVSRDIKRQNEWQHPSLIDPFVSTPDIVKAKPITHEDVHAARQNEIILNTQFCRQFNRYAFMSKLVKVFSQEGTVVVMTGWDYEDSLEEVEYPVYDIDPTTMEPVQVGTEVVTETVIKRNQPTAKVCRNEDVFIDPTCQDDLNKAQFVIYRYETDMSTLISEGKYSKKRLKQIEYDQGDDDYESPDDTTFKFSDDPRKKLVVYEYWGNYDVDGDGVAEPIVCAWVNKTLIRLESNPYPDQKPPFIVAPFSSVPFQMFGEPNAAMIGDNQQIKTAVYRGIIDNMAMSNNGQKGIRKNTLDPVNRARFYNGEHFEFNGGSGDFFDGSYNQLPGSVFDVIHLQNNEIESLTGTKSFSGGITGQSLGNMLDIETDIPLIDGSWKKLVDVRDGDVLVGSDGKGTTVLKAHEIKLPEVAYDMHFDNGAVVKSGGEHLWTIKVGGTKHSLREWHTVDADTVYEHVKKGRRVTIPKIQEVHTGKHTGNSTVTLKSMKVVDEVPMRCLTVDSKDKLFAVTDKFVLTHNTATGARGALDAAATRKLDLVRNIAENLIKPLMRKWIAYNSEFLTEEQVVRVTSEEFVTVRRDDLEGRVDIDISISTSEDNAAKAQELAFMLQTMGNTMDPMMSKMILVEIARLQKMPDLAKKIEEYESQPDPMAVKEQELRLALLEAEIANEQAKGRENEVNSYLKTARTHTEVAKAKNLSSEADLKDLSFLEKESGIDHAKALERDDNSTMNKAVLEQAKAVGQQR